MMRTSASAILLLILLSQCTKDRPDPGDLSSITYQPHAYQVTAPVTFPQMEIPADNPMTEEGIDLGRRLFFDPILSADSTMACASCHLPQSSFTDNLPVSPGIDGINGRRSAMSLLNVGFYNRGLFWDGRSASLEEQALLPVEDQVELHHSWTRVVEDLKRHPDYPEKFREAFGIKNTSEITKELAAKAIAQFERTLISSGNSKFDRVQRQEAFFTDEELNGYIMFFDRGSGFPDAECAHCHNAPLFTTNEYINNGIEDIQDLTDFPDMGRGAITAKTIDNGRFRVPTLRNLAFTAPYMHDGRFKTLDEVLDHYLSGGHNQLNKDALIYPLKLSEEQKSDLKAFILTLTDPDFLTNPAYQNPFD